MARLQNAAVSWRSAPRVSSDFAQTSDVSKKEVSWRDEENSLACASGNAERLSFREQQDWPKRRDLHIPKLGVSDRNRYLPILLDHDKLPLSRQ
jgi:hypothetical protein